MGSLQNFLKREVKLLTGEKLQRLTRSVIEVKVNDKMLPKLVRDRIPEIIKESGREPVHRKASSFELNYLLIEKMKEELNEFKHSPCLEEAADMYEVFLSILDHWNLEFSKVKNVALMKKDIRGSFESGIVLDEIISPPKER